MAPATLLSLRDRLARPAARRPGPGPEARRALGLAAELFGVAGAALVLARPGGLAVEAAAGPVAEPEALAAACTLFEALAADPPVGRAAGVMERVEPGRGFAAATPVMSAAGRCLGAVCLLDEGRRVLLTGLQRRLFAEFGDLMLSGLGAAEADPAARLQALADAEPDAFALFDAEGRCLLRNARFDALAGAALPGEPAGADLAAARGREAGWLAQRLARDLPPAGVHRLAMADGAWLSLEERRGPHGRSLIARVEGRDAFGGDGEMGHLFERCPAPMFVVDRDTRAVLAANDAALALYGWDRDGFLRLDLDRIGPVDPAPRGWTHRARDGRALSVSGRTAAVTHRGRAALLVTVTAGEDAPAGRAA